MTQGQTVQDKIDVFIRLAVREKDAEFRHTRIKNEKKNGSIVDNI